MQPRISPSRISRPVLGLLLGVLAAATAGCSVKSTSTAGKRITVDGSSTVYPISQAMAEEFRKEREDIAVPVQISGTGGGFKRFVTGDLDICDASRPIEKAETDACEKNGVRYLELKIGTDGISVVVNAKNTWCDVLTVEQLKKLWINGSKIKTWNDLDPSFPKQQILLYGPDTASGTFDYFTEVICGKKGDCRHDYQGSGDDNVLVQGVQGDLGALGYFGFAYYQLNRSSLKAVRIAPGSDKSAAIAPTDQTILDGTYRPLSRPLFLYVNKKSLKRPEVAEFLEFYMKRSPALVKEVHYIPLPESGYSESRARLKAALEEK